MIDESYFPFSLNSYEESYQEDAFCQIFNPVLEPMDIKDEINSDKVYFVNGKTDPNIRNLNQYNNYEDFDEFYKKFADLVEDNEINGDNNYINSNNEKPSFYVNVSHEAIFSTFENEMLINVIINNECVNKLKCCEKINIEEKSHINDDNTFQKPKNIKKKTNEETNYFPFTQAKGIIYGYNLKTIEESNSSVNNAQSLTIENGDCMQSMEKNYEEDSLNTEQINNINNGNNCYDFKFKTKKYCILPNGKKRREKKKRKFKSDDIRKKIKSRFHKTLKNIINDMLKKAGSKMLFDFLPQCFIGNISKKINSKCLELTYKELLSTNFIKELKKDKEIENNAEYKKYLKNKETLEYLEKNKEISKNSGFDIIKDRKYKELLKVYFSSSEFEDSIVRLKQENESSDYIQEYIYRAKHYVDFYSKNNNSEEKEDVDSDEE